MQSKLRFSLWNSQQPDRAEFRRWTEAGIRVFLYDCHSFGRSEPLDAGHRSLVVSYEHLADDVYTFRKVIKPLFAGPHCRSMLDT